MVFLRAGFRELGLAIAMIDLLCLADWQGGHPVILSPPARGADGWGICFPAGSGKQVAFRKLMIVVGAFTARVSTFFSSVHRLFSRAENAGKSMRLLAAGCCLKLRERPEVFRGSAWLRRGSPRIYAGEQRFGAAESGRG
jgi:hypothetical protein